MKDNTFFFFKHITCIQVAVAVVKLFDKAMKVPNKPVPQTGMGSVCMFNHCTYIEYHAIRISCGDSDKRDAPKHGNTL